MEQEKSYEEWYDAFLEFTRSFGYHGPVDKEAFMEEWEAGKDAYETAREFVDEMNE